MNNKKKKEKLLIGPVYTIMIVTVIIALISLIFNLIGIEGRVTSIVGETLVSTMVTVKNVLSSDGIRHILSNIITNFSTFEPLVIMIISIIGIGIAEKSGLFKILFSNVKKLKPSRITMITLLVSIGFSFIGEHAFAIVLPLAGIFYKYAGKNSRLGILTAFIGLTIGYGTGFMFGNIDILLGKATQLSASLEVDKNYTFNLISNIFLMLGSLFILVTAGTLIIEKCLTKHFPKKTPLLDEEIHVSKKGLIISSGIALVCILIFIYMIIPGLPLSGLLLDKNAEGYIAKLLSDTAPFRQSFVFLLTFLFMICGLVYGKISGNIKNTNDYSIGLAKGFEGTGYMFVLLFFTSQLIAILDWTNLGTVISAKLIEFIGTIQLSGIPLIVSFFLIVVLITLLIPSITEKWMLLNPIAIPLFMRSNITPDFTQFIFKAADGVGKAFTPIFPYFVVMLSLLQKYNYDDDNKITIFGTLRMMLPTLFCFTLLWLLIIIGWYIVGLPIGPNVFATMI